MTKPGMQCGRPMSGALERKPKNTNSTNNARIAKHNSICFAGNGGTVSDLDTYAFNCNPIEVTIHSLLHPPPSAFIDGILSLTWAVLTASWSHFEPRDPDERPVLTRHSELRTRGRELGIPEAYHTWLCGNDLSYTESEDGFCLTPAYFKGLC